LLGRVALVALAPGVFDLVISERSIVQRDIDTSPYAADIPINTLSGTTLASVTVLPKSDVRATSAEGGKDFRCPEGTRLVRRLIDQDGVPRKRWCEKQNEASRWVRHGPMEHLRRDGRPFSLGYYRDGLPHGDWAHYGPSGHLSEKGRREFGLRQGPWTRWWKSGRVREEGSYARRQRVGRWTEYYPDGTKAAEGKWKGCEFAGQSGAVQHCKRGPQNLVDFSYRHGEWSYWDPFAVSIGSLRFEEGRILEFAPPADESRYCPDGADVRGAPYRDGLQVGCKKETADTPKVRHGRFLVWSAAGQLRRIERYWEGKLHGAQFELVGPLWRKRTEYDHGEPTGVHIWWHGTETRALECHFEESGSPRACVDWNSKGQLCHYRKWEEDWMWDVSWWPHGSLRSEGRCREGRRIGTWQLWSRDGSARQQDYLDGPETQIRHCGSSPLPLCLPRRGDR
jgi:antitoxin component YwqK of YwqJK toxin-antitoxin module